MNATDCHGVFPCLGPPVRGDGGIGKEALGRVPAESAAPRMSGPGVERRWCAA
jgi:hypothetical protein